MIHAHLSVILGKPLGRRLTSALSASGPTVALRLQQHPPPGRDALQGRVRPTASGAARYNPTLRFSCFGFASLRSRSCPIPALRVVRTYPAAGTTVRRLGASCGTAGPGRDRPCAQSSAPPGSPASLFVNSFMMNLVESKPLWPNAPAHRERPTRGLSV
jgi:hypothetical protein